MPENISVRAIVGPTKQALSNRSRAADRAAMWAVRECGRQVKRAAKAKARVYEGSGGVSVSRVRRARKAGVNLAGEALGAGQTVEGNQVVKGLLRSSISSSKRIDNFGGVMRITVAPRGPRVHLYARKIEDLDHYMSDALAAVTPLMSEIHASALKKAMGV